MITAAQIAQIQEIISEHMTSLTFAVTGSAPTPEDIATLKRAGIIASDIPDSVLSDAFLYGVVTTLDPAVLEGPPEELLDKIRTTSLTPLERRTVKALCENAANYMKGLGNRIRTSLMGIIYDARKEEMMREIYRHTLTEGAIQGKTRSQIVTDLRDATGDFHRDLERVVNTELHAARTEGIAQGIRKRWGVDAYAFVRPNPDACPICKEAYLETDGRPKIFRLAALEVSNVGRPKEELTIRPGKPPLHPHCQCQMAHIDPLQQELDANGNLTFKRPL